MILELLSTLCLPENKSPVPRNEKEEWPIELPLPLLELSKKEQEPDQADANKPDVDAEDPASTASSCRSCLRDTASPRSPKADLHVTFADDIGYPLNETFFLEPPQESNDDDDDYNKLQQKVRRNLSEAIYPLAASANALPGNTNKKMLTEQTPTTLEKIDPRPPSSSDCKVELIFRQPAADFVKLSQTLETYNVALENVWLSDCGRRLSGSVRARHFVSDQEFVFIRSTTNGWTNYIDSPARFTNSDVSNTNDIFQWDLGIETSSTAKFSSAGVAKIEFFVCLKVCRNNVWTEFYDNNGGPNYKLYLKRKPAIPCVFI